MEIWVDRGSSDPLRLLLSADDRRLGCLLRARDAPEAVSLKGWVIRSPYEALLGAAFAALHPQVQRAHLPPLRAEGELDVEHGRGWLVRQMIWLMKLPAAGLHQPVQLDLAEDGSELVWTRSIGGTRLRTQQHASGSRLVERTGLGRIFFNLRAEDGTLLYRQSSFRVAGVPVPSLLSPRVSAVVSAATEGWRVVVTVEWRGRFVCRYAGIIRAV